MAISRRSWIGRVIGGAIAGFAAKPESSKLVFTPLPDRFTQKTPEPIPYMASGAYFNDEETVRLIEVTTHGDTHRRFIPGYRRED